MKKNVLYRKSSFNHFLIFNGFLVLLVLIAVPLSTNAAESIVLEGMIQGAACTHNQTKCPEDRLDPHIAIENDFVLSLEDGRHFFLPNLNRGIKARYVSKVVRIAGKLDGHGIWVDRMDVKKGSKFENVWSWEEQKQMYQRSGG